MSCLGIAHRGVAAVAPENTLASFEEALRLGAPMIELDVHRMAGGQLVVVHDDTIDRTTNGKGKVREMTLDQIRAYDAGSWFAPRFAGQRVPTLAEVIDLVRGRAGLNVELKTSSRTDPGVEGELIDLLKEEDFLDQVIISSFDYDALRVVKDLEPAVRTGVLCVAGTGSAIQLARRIGADALHPYFVFATPWLVARAHRHGLRVNAWTVDNPVAAAFLIKSGADGIISNTPKVLAMCRNREVRH